MSQGEWEFVSEYGLNPYPNGLRSGDCLELLQELVIRDHRGNPTGRTHQPGEVWTVLPGVVDEPEVIWLRTPGGSRHTWDSSSLFQWFRKRDDTA